MTSTSAGSTTTTADDESTTEEIRMDVLPVCGDGMLDPETEDCDGAELSEPDCAALDYDEGALSCTDDCVFDLSECMGGDPPCGNGMRDPGEECDDTDFGTQTCETLLESEDYSGSPYCTPGTCEIDTSTCCLVEAAECVTLLEAPFECCPGLSCELDLMGGLSSCK